MFREPNFEDKEFCEYCEGSGRVSVVKTLTDGVDYEFCYRCICKNGEKFNILKEVNHRWLREKINKSLFRARG